MSIVKNQPSSIIKQQPSSIVLGIVDTIVPPTERPAKATYTATALPASIRIDIDRTAGINRAEGHRVRIRRRNTADTAWEAVQPWIDIGRSRSYTFTDYTSTQTIEPGRKYQVKAIGYNVIGDGPEGDYIEVVPLVVATGSVPDTPTLQLSIDPSSFTDIILTPLPTGTPNPAITHWLIRHRVQGQSDWTTEAVVADQSTFTFTGSRGQTIEFQLAARNDRGDSAFTATQSIRIIDIPNRPDLFLTAQPAGFDVRIVSQPSGDPPTSQSFRYRQGTSGDWIPGPTSEIRGLLGSTIYQVQAWLTNDAGRSLSVTRTITTLPVRLVRGDLAVYGNSLAVYGDHLKVYGA